MKADPLYKPTQKKHRTSTQSLRKNITDSKAQKMLSQAKASFKELNSKFSFSEYGLHDWGKRFTKSWLNIGADAVQKMASCAFTSIARHVYEGGGRPRYKGKRGVQSIEAKKNAIKLKDGIVTFGDISMPLMSNPEDVVHLHGLKSRLKYIRIVRKPYGGHYRYFAQLVSEGEPYQKPKNKIGSGKLCLDIGPQTIGTVSVANKQARLDLFAASVETEKKKLKAIQRQVARQLRDANPQAFASDRWTKKDKHWVRKQGKVKKGVAMKNRSANLTQNFIHLQDKERMIAKHRKDLHGELANNIIALGTKVVTENISIKGFQKLYGKSIGNRAPGMFLEILKRKAENAGGSMEKFSTRTTMLSQMCHCGSRVKKPLRQRWHVCACGTVAQRDLYSAYLGNFVESNQLLASDAVKHWKEMDIILRSAMGKVESSNEGHYPASMGAKRVDRPSACSDVGQRRSSGKSVEPRLRPTVAMPLGEVLSLPEPPAL
jgi:transposase